MCVQPLVSRLLQLANDVELNPGPLAHKLVRPSGVSGVSGVSPMAGRDKKQPLKVREAATDGQREANVGLYTASSVEDLRFVIERQNDQILIPPSFCTIRQVSFLYLALILLTNIYITSEMS